MKTTIEDLKSEAHLGKETSLPEEFYQALLNVIEYNKNPKDLLGSLEKLYRFLESSMIYWDADLKNELVEKLVKITGNVFVINSARIKASEIIYEMLKAGRGDFFKPIMMQNCRQADWVSKKEIETVLENIQKIPGDAASIVRTSLLEAFPFEK